MADDKWPMGQEVLDGSVMDYEDSGSESGSDMDPLTGNKQGLSSR